MWRWLLLLGLLAPAPGRAAPDGLDDLLGRFRAMPGLEAAFHEEKRFALLDAPLVSEGTLHFQPPGRLARHVTAPARSTVLLDGDRLAFGDEHGRAEVDLARRPVVRLFVDAFVKVLAGDRPALERIFELEHAQGDDDTWGLVLRPRASPLKDAIERLELRGRGVVLTRMRLVEVGGDETLTTFSGVDAARRYGPDEAARVFRLPGRGG
ncbi:MAG: outer membrane lipoprotein carrier protein LolA [Planctomycetes bacterium]|nr:outer membrane lipoprotein carrier protein LolA [Planctomycetota bacterium]